MICDTHVDHGEHEEQAGDEENPGRDEQAHERCADSISTPDTGSTSGLDGLVCVRVVSAHPWHSPERDNASDVQKPAK